MTAPAPPPPAPPPAPSRLAPPSAPRSRPGRDRFRRRWYRLAVPFAVLVLLMTVTLVARATQEPDLDDPGTLSPAGTGQDGSSELARMLDERGVRVEYVTDIDAATSAAATGEDAVVFIPRPTTFGMRFAAMVGLLPGDHRLVLVAPNDRELSMARVPTVRTGPSRWATTDTLPGCGVPEAVAAGRAAVLRSRYVVTGGDSCYDGGLVRSTTFPAPGPELFVAGSSDPFRNRRIHEYGNAELAVGLLSTYDRVIWLGALPFDPGYDWDADPPDMDVDLPDVDRPEVDAPSRGERDRSDDSIFGGLAQNYGAAAPTALALAILVAVLVALAMARRPGAPVSEPLPVVVPAAEAVAGRGRLYQRAGDQRVAMAALRAAAISRIAVAVGLPANPPPEPDDLVAAVARTGLPEADVRRTLYGPEPTTDQQLTEMVADLDALVQVVTREGGPS